MSRRIRPISPRQAEKNRLEAIVRRRWWNRISADGWPRCAVTGKPAGKQPHHIIPKSVRPDLRAVEANFLPVHLEGHEKIHRNPTWARAHGYLGFSTDSLDELSKRRIGHPTPTLNPVVRKGGSR